MTAATAPHHDAPGLPARRTMFLRALARRCPACGGGPVFRHWFRMVPRCPSCGLRFERGEHGYHLGAVWFNLIFAEAVSMGIFFTVLIRTWPTPPWDVLEVMAPVDAVVAPFFFYPFAKTLFLAFDLSIRPPSPEDYG